MSDEIKQRLKEAAKIASGVNDYTRVTFDWLITTVREQMARAEAAEARLNQRSLDLDDAHTARLRAEKYRVEIEDARKWEAVAARERIEREIRANERAEAAEKKLSAEEEEFIAMRNDRDYAEKACAAMRAALELVITFHSGGQWTAEKAHAWEVATGSSEATTKLLCDYLRAVARNGDAGKDWVPRAEAEMFAQRQLSVHREWVKALEEVDMLRAELEQEKVKNKTLVRCCEDAVSANRELRAELGAANEKLRLLQNIKGNVADLAREQERQRCAEIVRGLGGKPEEELPGWNWVVSDAVRQILGGA